MVFEKPKLPISLYGVEVVYLTDSITNKDVAEGLPDKDAYVPLARETLLLLSSAYCELVKDGPADQGGGILIGPVTLHLTEEMTWLLRGKVKTGDVAIDGKTNIGVGLLLKLYGLLQQFNSDLGDWPIAEEPSHEGAIVRLQAFRDKEKANAGAETYDDPDSNIDPYGGA